mgnify:CR=1 FL=1
MISYDGDDAVMREHRTGAEALDRLAGIDLNKDGNDDVMIQSDVINLENNRPVKILLRSVDVLHNWYVPQFRAKMDAVPGIVTYYWFEPNKTGEFEVLCAESVSYTHLTLPTKRIV